MTLPDTLLPLTRFSELVGYSPVLFNQVFIPGEQEASECSDPVLEYLWQQRGGGQPGRYEIALAVQRAEQTLAEHLGFTVAPTYHTDTVQPVRAVGAAAATYSALLYDVPVVLSSSYVQQMGARAEAFVGSTPVVYIDEDGDDYKETGLVEVYTTHPASELRVFYPGYDPAYGERREIRPIVATQGTGIVSIRFPRYLAVRFELLESYTAAGVDGTNDDNFLFSADVYREYVDASRHAVVSWEPAICSESLGTVDTQTGFGFIRDPKLGIVRITPASYNSITGNWTRLFPEWWRTPTSVTVNYVGGYPLDARGRMNSQLERAVVFLALNYLDCPWTTCEPLHALMEHWRQDMAERRSSPGESVGYIMAPAMLNNPLGTTRAAVNAWRVVQQFATGRAVAY